MIFRKHIRRYLIYIILLGITSIFAIFSYIENNISYAIFGVGIAIIIYYINHVASLEREELINSLESTRRTIEDSMSESFSSTAKIYENQSKALTDYSSIIKSTQYEVNILGATLTSFFWIPDFEEATLNALQKGVNFRVLILNPTSDAIKFLSKQEHQSDENLKNEILRSINKWNELQDRAPRGGIEIRLYDSLPIGFLLITDARLLFAPYLSSDAFLPSPCFELKATESIYKSYRNFFENMWRQ